jgi:uncharacterized HAD superfamily protein
MKHKAPVVFDIDGTLTSEHYNEDNLLTLKENPTMLLLALALQAERPLVVSTARPEYLRVETETWLKSKGLKPDKVYMRSSDEEDTEDFLVKEKHLKKILKEFGMPVTWCDDNLDNIAMLKRHNVPCIAIHSTWGG